MYQTHAVSDTRAIQSLSESLQGIKYQTICVQNLQSFSLFCSFFLRNSSEVCGDPELDWVQRCMRRIDQMEYNIMMQTSNSSSQS
ncbi:hypothetical protein C0J45_24093 [Silurus meridionalis]|nr:hypothetical protein C0J45_24093 [Silurus meridionalis]